MNLPTPSIRLKSRRQHASTCWCAACCLSVAMWCMDNADVWTSLRGGRKTKHALFAPDFPPMAPTRLQQRSLLPGLSDKGNCIRLRVNTLQAQLQHAFHRAIISESSTCLENTGFAHHNCCHIRTRDLQGGSQVNCTHSIACVPMSTHNTWQV